MPLDASRLPIQANLDALLMPAGCAVGRSLSGHDSVNGSHVHMHASMAAADTSLGCMERAAHPVHFTGAATEQAFTASKRGGGAGEGWEAREPELTVCCWYHSWSF